MKQSATKNCHFHCLFTTNEEHLALSALHRRALTGRDGSSFSHLSICPGDTVGQTSFLLTQQRRARTARLMTVMIGVCILEQDSNCLAIRGACRRIQIRPHLLCSLLAMFCCLVYPERYIKMVHYNIVMEVNSKTNEVAHGIKEGFNYERCGYGF